VRYSRFEHFVQSMPVHTARYTATEEEQQLMGSWVCRIRSRRHRLACKYSSTACTGIFLPATTTTSSSCPTTIDTGSRSLKEAPTATLLVHHCPARSAPRAPARPAAFQPPKGPSQLRRHHRDQHQFFPFRHRTPATPFRRSHPASPFPQRRLQLCLPRLVFNTSPSWSTPIP